MADPLALDALHAILRTVRTADGTDLVAAGLFDTLDLQDGIVRVTLRAPRAAASAMEPLRAAAEAALRRQPGVRAATVVLTAHAPMPTPTPTPAAAPASRAIPAPPGRRPKLLPSVPILAIASGKGGVGKSTVAVNLSVALARAGHRIGLLDADIHGPSLPRLLGITARAEPRDGRLEPIHAWGLTCASMGFLVGEDQAMIWRGPMVMGALEQLLGQVNWGALDLLVVDMPPGTGDAQLTLAQRTDLAGAVIVSTPQDLALIDARRGVAMFRQVGVPIVGLIENMSSFCCPRCGYATPLFGAGGVRAEADRLGIDFLGAIPLILAIREASDAGTPIAATAPASAAGQTYAAIAEAVWRQLEPARRSR